MTMKTEKAVAPHSSTLAWKIPWMEEPGGLLSMGSPIISWQIDGETMETVADVILGGSKITADGNCVMKLKDTCSLEEKL